MRFYTYVYFDDDWEPYYVGKGEKWRAYTNHNHPELPAEGRTQFFYFDEEWQALECEQELIGLWGRQVDGGTLLNKTRGGLGTWGLHWSEEHRSKISESNRKRIISDETRRKFSKAKQNPSEETRAKISESNRRRTVSDETRKKMSESAKRRGLNPQQRPGRKLSEETKRKISQTLKNRYAK